MESVEVWMWVIAGLLVGVIVLASGFLFLSKYIESAQINQAEKSASALANVADTVCLAGKNTKQTRNFYFPYIVRQIYLFDEEKNIKGRGKSLFIEFYNNKDFTIELECSSQMKTISLDKESDFFYMIQDYLGENKVANVKFSITNLGDKRLNISWEKEMLR